MLYINANFFAFLLFYLTKFISQLEPQRSKDKQNYTKAFRPLVFILFPCSFFRCDYHVTPLEESIPKQRDAGSFMVAVETVRDGQILDVSTFSDRLDVEYEEKRRP